MPPVAFPAAAALAFGPAAVFGGLDPAAAAEAAAAAFKSAQQMFAAGGAPLGPWGFFGAPAQQPLLQPQPLAGAAVKQEAAEEQQSQAADAPMPDAQPPAAAAVVEAA